MEHGVVSMLVFLPAEELDHAEVQLHNYRAQWPALLSLLRTEQESSLWTKGHRGRSLTLQKPILPRQKPERIKNPILVPGLFPNG